MTYARQPATPEGEPPQGIIVDAKFPEHRLGQAQTLADVFPLHTLPALGGQTIAAVLNALQQSDLLAFLKSIDGTTTHIPSEGDAFRDALRLQGTCPAP